VDELMSILQRNAPQLAEQIVRALNDAPDGRWLAASEEPVRDAGQEFIRAVYEAAVQRKVDSAEAAFSPSAGCTRQTQGEQGPATDHVLDHQWPDQSAASLVALLGRGQ
jgi:hypothetical protein